MTPINCKCGCAPCVDSIDEDGAICWYVRCVSCDTIGVYFRTITLAVMAWNRKMEVDTNG